jgi:lipoate-protein ligase B
MNEIENKKQTDFIIYETNNKVAKVSVRLEEETVEHLFSIEMDLTCFFKGFGCGLELIGVVVLIMKKREITAY